MTKHRLELFSDGVFAIVLTLLALDLKVPLDRGLQGLVDIAPALLVHAFSFFILGVFWMIHHGGLARVVEISSRTLLLNLLGLFWITLVPFAARIAAEHPLEPLGPCLLSASTGAYFVSLLATRLSAHSVIDDNPRLRAWRRGRIVLAFALVAANFLGAVLSWATPWAGYAVTLATVITFLVMPAPAEVEARIGQEPA